VKETFFRKIHFGVVTDNMFSEEEVPHFTAPITEDNSSVWGPCDMPGQFKDMPYQPFSKGDRLGKVNQV
jgi:translation initiation factor 3 subunit D